MSGQYWNGEDNPSGFPSGQGYVEVKPWIRLWARLLDYLLFISLIFLGTEWFSGKTPDFPYNFLLYLFSVFLWNIVEAAFLSLLGYTPGKWLLGVRVRDEQDKKLRFLHAWKRSLLVWLTALWIGLPLVFIPALLRSHDRLFTNRKTDWDAKAGSMVSHNYDNGLKIAASFALYAFFFWFLVLFPNKEFLESQPGFITTNGYTYADKAANLNLAGYNLMEKGSYEEAKVFLLEGLASGPGPDTKEKPVWASFRTLQPNTAITAMRWTHWADRKKPWRPTTSHWPWTGAMRIPTMDWDLYIIPWGIMKMPL